MALKSFIVASALTIASAAHAGPDRLSFLLGSEHVNAGRSFEEINPGIFLTWSESVWQNRLDLTVGAFRNSYGDGSLVASLAYPIVRKEHWGIDVFGAIAWYPDNGEQFTHSFEDLVPIGGLQVRYRNVFVQAIPAGGQAVDATLAFGLTFAIGD